MTNSWVKEAPLAVTVADETGTIIEMNDWSVDTFEKYGGKALIGKNINDVHSYSHATNVFAPKRFYFRQVY